MSLIAHLNSRFRGGEENFAAEALRYVLAQSREASDAFTKAMRTAVPDLPESLAYRTQVIGDSKERPDLDGRTDAGAVGVVIDSKF